MLFSYYNVMHFMIDNVMCTVTTLWLKMRQRHATDHNDITGRSLPPCRRAMITQKLDLFWGVNRFSTLRGAKLVSNPGKRVSRVFWTVLDIFHHNLLRNRDPNYEKSIGKWLKINIKHENINNKKNRLRRAPSPGGSFSRGQPPAADCVGA